MRPFVFPVACYTVCYTIESRILVFLQTLFRLVTQSLKKDCVTSPKSVSIGACIQSHYYLILFCWKQHIASKRNTVSRKPFKCALTGWVHVHMLIAGRFTIFFLARGCWAIQCIHNQHSTYVQKLWMHCGPMFWSLFHRLIFSSWQCLMCKLNTFRFLPGL